MAYGCGCGCDGSGRCNPVSRANPRRGRAKYARQNPLGESVGMGTGVGILAALTVGLVLVGTVADKFAKAR